ncbi:AOX-domain-containing protein [Canariomyces notabilis]|uniref:AOX-domain-containing protein n=1 Tax=Canariomyces notabilis TaxID=2074819 RepID=A0AAN6YVT4_9PEZI|nr:AOX-domain-containing protein [Canariomyces arenarius]
MISVGPGKNICSLSPKQAAKLSQAAAPLFCKIHPVAGLGYPVGLRAAAAIHQSRQPTSSTRHFSTTSSNQLRDFFPRKETTYIRQTPPAWPHHGYTEEEMLSVVPEHRKPKTVSDWLAWRLVRLCR